MENDKSVARDSEFEAELVVPVIREEVHVDAVPVVTGGVRVVKRVETHDELVEQELRKGRVEVRRVPVNRVVDGPQAAQKDGNTLVIPVVAETVRIVKEWVLTEEIHITQLEEREHYEERIPLSHEVAEVFRFDRSGEATRLADDPAVEGDTPGRNALHDLPGVLRAKMGR